MASSIHTTQRCWRKRSPDHQGEELTGLRVEPEGQLPLLGIVHHGSERDPADEGARDEECHERRCDAVVQSALDVENPTDALRDVGLLDDLCTESGVGRCDCGRDHRRRPWAEIWEQDDCEDGPEPDGQWKPDEQQSA